MFVLLASDRETDKNDKNSGIIPHLNLQAAIAMEHFWLDTKPHFAVVIYWLSAVAERLIICLSIPSS